MIWAIAPQVLIEEGHTIKSTCLIAGLTVSLCLPVFADPPGKDEAEEIGRLRTACDQGKAVGCHGLAFKYRNGFEVDKDRKQEVRFYRRACRPKTRVRT